MRIVSLLPAATEWLCAFGAGDNVVGRSHACDWPPEVQNCPILTQPTADLGNSAAAIDHVVQETVQAGLSLYAVDLDQLWALQPDLIVTQTQCAVCAVDRSALDAALADWTGMPPLVFDFAPITFKQVVDQTLALGRAAERLPEAMHMIAQGELQLRTLRDRLQVTQAVDAGTPTVACIEWTEPLMIAGHWMPDLVAHAGGRAALAEAGQPSPVITWETLVESDPDVIIVAACGRSIEEGVADLTGLQARAQWKKLQAVQHGRVFVFDGSAYFNRPGPRLVRSVELLAAALHGNRAGVSVEPGGFLRVEA